MLTPNERVYLLGLGERIDLSGASFSGADLHNANLFEANLIGAKFGIATHPADVAGVNFRGAQRDGADFRWAKHLTLAQIAEAASAEGVLLPTYLSEEGDPALVISCGR